MRGDIVSLEIEGKERINKELNKLSSRMRRRGLKKGTGAGARALKKELKRVLNKRGGPAKAGSSPAIDTGNLMRSVDIKYPKARKGWAYALVGHRRDKKSKWQGQQAHLLERGTVNMEPRPYFEPTFMRMANTMHRLIREKLTEVLYGA